MPTSLPLIWPEAAAPAPAGREPTAPLDGFSSSASDLEEEPPSQRTLDELGTPLSEVTFVVLDLETTGGSAANCAITEVGALKLQGGELLGTFDTLVNPGMPIPPTITVLTGITEAMVLPAPRIGEVLPTLLEFIGDAVVVGHNLRFDTSFIDAACAEHAYPPLANRRVDTLALARRLFRDEVPNLKLATLARHVRAGTVPCHRAYSDAAATAEVLHAMLERAGSLGVLGLDDLLALPTMRAHPSASKLRLTAKLPRKPGVYLFRDRHGRVLYVGKATNLRQRVRSYFSGDDRRKVPQMLRETTVIDHLVCRDAFEAEVRELRLIRELLPRFNRRSKTFSRNRYLKLTEERFPRLMVTGTVRSDGALYVGPLPSARAAHELREAVESALPVRRCTQRVGRCASLACSAPCVPAQLGVASCPCRGHTSADDYARVVDQVRRALSGIEPALVVEPLVARMGALAATERFEEAASTRDRVAAFVRMIDRLRLVERARRSGRVVLDASTGRVEIDDGQMCIADGPGCTPPLATPSDHGDICGVETIDEMLLVGRWLDRNGSRLRLTNCDGALWSSWPRCDDYSPRSSRAAAPDPGSGEPMGVGAVSVSARAEASRPGSPSEPSASESASGSASASEETTESATASVRRG